VLRGAHGIKSLKSVNLFDFRSLRHPAAQTSARGSENAPGMLQFARVDGKGVVRNLHPKQPLKRYEQITNSSKSSGRRSGREHDALRRAKSMEAVSPIYSVAYRRLALAGGRGHETVNAYPTYYPQIGSRGLRPMATAYLTLQRSWLLARPFTVARFRSNLCTRPQFVDLISVMRARASRLAG
jgi:hypothetical protein